MTAEYLQKVQRKDLVSFCLSQNTVKRLRLLTVYVGTNRSRGDGIWTREQLGNENPGGTFRCTSPEERPIALAELLLLSKDF